MCMLRQICGVKRENRISNEHIRGNLELATIKEKEFIE